MHSLAIVIPAYKAAFFDAALTSIAAQTDKRFTVYVGDDGSPDDLGRICQAYADRIDLRYHRFDRNLGGQDLVAHWTRCIELSDEPWVWLFSDDDVMDPGCVAAFYHRLSEDNGAYELYHFNVIEIDANGDIQKIAPKFETILPAYEFCLARLQGRISSYVPDYIFSRAALQREGGFQAFPLAWCSDDATWIKLARRKGIRSAGDQNVYWRRSGQNLTSSRPQLVQRKMEAAIRYLAWLAGYLAAHPPTASEPPPEELKLAARYWLLRHSRHLGAVFWPAHGLLAARRLRQLFRFGFPEILARTIYWDLRYRLRSR